MTLAIGILTRTSAQPPGTWAVACRSALFVLQGRTTHVRRNPEQTRIEAVERMVFRRDGRGMYDLKQSGLTVNDEILRKIHKQGGAAVRGAPTIL